MLCYNRIDVFTGENSYKFNEELRNSKLSYYMDIFEVFLKPFKR